MTPRKNDGDDRERGRDDTLPADARDDSEARLG